MTPRSRRIARWEAIVRGGALLRGVRGRSPRRVTTPLITPARSEVRLERSVRRAVEDQSIEPIDFDTAAVELGPSRAVAFILMGRCIVLTGDAPT